MTITTYYPIIITVRGRPMVAAGFGAGFVGYIPACNKKVSELRAQYKQAGLPYVVRRYCCNYVTYR